MGVTQVLTRFCFHTAFSINFSIILDRNPAFSFVLSSILAVSSLILCIEIFLQLDNRPRAFLRRYCQSFKIVQLNSSRALLSCEIHGYSFPSLVLSPTLIDLKSCRAITLNCSPGMIISFIITRSFLFLSSRSEFSIRIHFP